MGPRSHPGSWTTALVPLMPRRLVGLFHEAQCVSAPSHWLASLGQPLGTPSPALCSHCPARSFYWVDVPWAAVYTPGLWKLELCPSQRGFLPRGHLRSLGRLEQTENGPKYEEIQGRGSLGVLLPIPHYTMRRWGHERGGTRTTQGPF